MSSDEVAIRTHGLGKRYRLGVERNLTGNLREALAELPARLRRRAATDRAPSREGIETDRDVFWALRDVDLEVRRGEVLGVVGRNGAGKSTLLKVLSRITAPTTGSAEIRGRVGSLLEVGTGFHPELSGRDNVFLNGAILGMRRREIEAKFDEIVDFAEVGAFLDTPVKRYSSGMRVRLGFAVAAFLEPEILFVDEVLAVGDEGFRKKCLGKMDDIAGTGRTVLFVSHSMTAISSLCSRAVLIDEGRLVHSGGPREVIETYLERVSEDAKQPETGHFDLRERRNNYGDRDLIVTKLETLDAAFRPRAHFLMGDAMTLRVHLEGFSRHPESTLGITIKDAQDQWLASLNTAMSCRGVKEPRSDAELATLRIERLPLLPGRYYLSVSATLGPSAGYRRIDYVDRAASFEVVAADVYGSGYPMERKYGVFYLEGDWSIEGGVSAVEGEGESP